MISLTCCNTVEQNAPVSEVPAGTEQKMADAINYSGCYRMIIGRDTARMELSKTAAGFTGPLSYARYEKDSNKGTVTLAVKKGRLVGWYSFQSEGTISLREIVFRPVDNGLAEAFGEIKMQGDTAVFSYPAALQFEENHPFAKRPVLEKYLSCSDGNTFFPGLCA